jgi:hypothetical protein
MASPCFGLYGGVTVGRFGPPSRSGTPRRGPGEQAAWNPLQLRGLVSPSRVPGSWEADSAPVQPITLSEVH